MLVEKLMLSQDPIARPERGVGDPPFQPLPISQPPSNVGTRDLVWGNCTHSGGILIRIDRPTLRKQVLEWRFSFLQEMLHNLLELPEVWGRPYTLTRRAEPSSAWELAIRILLKDLFTFLRDSRD